MKRLFLLALMACLPLVANAAVVFSRTTYPAAGFSRSSWVNPDGNDADEYSYDSFQLGGAHTISEVRWHGFYEFDGTMPDGTKEPVTDFRITFYDSISGGLQPSCVNPDTTETIFLANHKVGSNAGETPGAIVGGKQMYDYDYVLPMPFQVSGHKKFWLKIEASQPLYPDWAVAMGKPGDSRNFHYRTGLPTFMWNTAGKHGVHIANRRPGTTRHDGRCRRRRHLGGNFQGIWRRPRET